MFLKNAFIYSTTNLLSQILLFGQSFVIRHLLLPHVLGIWNFVTVIQGFLTTFDLGITTAALRELPMLRGSGNIDGETEARSTAFWSRIGQGFLFLVGILLYIAFFRQDDQYRVAFLVAAALIIISSISESLITFHQGAQQYIPLSRILLLNGILYALLLPVGAYLGGLFGLMISAVVSSMIQVALLFSSCSVQSLNIQRFWNWHIFKRQLGFGLPLRIVDYPQSFFSMIDVLFITKFIGVEALAIYTTARAMVSQSIDILARMGIVLITRINEYAGNKTGRRQVANELRDFLFLEYLVLIPAIICIVLYSISFLILLFIPKYSASIPVLKILMCTIYFVPQTSIVRNFWILDKRLVSIGTSNMVGLAGTLAVLYVAIEIHGGNLESVAWATIGGYVIYYLYLMFSVGLKVWDRKTVFVLCLAAFISCGYTNLIVISSPSLTIPVEGYSTALLNTLMKVFRALLLLSPLFLIGVWLMLRDRNSKICMVDLMAKLKKYLAKRESL